MDSFETRLRAVDWSQYHHAYGPAVDVPELLMAIARADTDADAFEEAVDALWGNVFHQGTRWGVTAKTVPFFIELLGTGGATARGFLVRYLHHLAVGYPEGQFPEAFPIDDLAKVAAILEARADVPRSAFNGDIFGDPDPVVEELQNHFNALWERDCFLAVERGVPTVLGLLRDSETALVLDAVALLSSFPGQRALSEPRLWELARDAEAVGLRGPALVALARLSGGDASTEVIQAAQVLMDADDGVDGLYAACAEVLGSPTPSEVARRRLSRGQVSGDCPFMSTLTAMVSLCVERAPPSDPAEALDQLISLLAASKGFEKLSVLDRLLTFAFPTPASALTPEQRRVVEALVDHALWLEQGELANQNHLLRRAGLPVDRHGLRALLR